MKPIPFSLYLSLLSSIAFYPAHGFTQTRAATTSTSGGAVVQGSQTATGAATAQPQQGQLNSSSQVPPVGLTQAAPVVSVAQTNSFGQISSAPAYSNVPPGSAQSGQVAGLLSNVTVAIPVTQTDAFGRLTGVTFSNLTTNIPISGGVAGNTAGGFGTVGNPATATTTVTPGNTQVTITLQGAIASELDRQVILQRFQGLPGFNVVDQLQVVSPNVNEAAGANNASPAERATNPTAP